MGISHFSSRISCQQVDCFLPCSLGWREVPFGPKGRSSSEIFFETFPYILPKVLHCASDDPQISFYWLCFGVYFYCMCHSTHVELRRQLLGIGSHHVGSWDWSCVVCLRTGTLNHGGSKPLRQGVAVASPTQISPRRQNTTQLIEYKMPTSTGQMHHCITLSPARRSPITCGFSRPCASVPSSSSSSSSTPSLLSPPPFSSTLLFLDKVFC